MAKAMYITRFIRHSILGAAVLACGLGFATVAVAQQPSQSAAAVNERNIQPETYCRFALSMSSSDP